MRTRRTERGFTLVELMISTACGALLLAAGVTLATGHTRVMSRTAGRTETGQVARLTMDLLSSDLRMAGVGVGYRPNGSFAGLARGRFAVLGGAVFDATDFPIRLESGSLTTDDIGIRHASGRVRTIADFSAASAQICAGSGLDAGDLAVITTREGLHSRTIRVGDVVAAGCTGGLCAGGCERFSWTADGTYVSDPYATEASYVEGELMADYAEIVWFVTPTSAGRGVLRRAEIDVQNPCTARDATCGGVVARGVESVQIALWQWDSTNDGWVNRTASGDVTDRDRIRVDVEVVVAGSKEHRVAGGRSPTRMKLNNEGCVPAPCGAEHDGIERRVLRSSVEIRNSGRMQLR